MLALDVPGLARTRLRDVRVTGETALVDAGTVVVGRGAALTALVVTRSGEPVQGHDVLLDDGTLLGPIRIPPAKTDTEGRVRFERMAPGAYRLRMRGLERCPLWEPIVQRLVRVSFGEVHERVILDTVSLTLRFSFGGTPVSVQAVTIKPESSPAALPTWLHDPEPFLAFRWRSPFDFGDPACQGHAAAGRVNTFTFSNVPSGDAQVNAVIGGSRWTRRIKVPPNGGEIVVQPHDGIAPLRVIAADDRTPVSGAVVTWKSGGTEAEVEGASQANGEVLLQGISAGAGNMTVRLQGFRALSRDFAVPPDVLHEIPLERQSRAAWSCRVLDERGNPIPNAVVQVIPSDPMEPPVVSTTDASGDVRFIELRVGAARVVAMAPGYAASVESIKLAAESGDAAIVLERGYRALVEAPGGAAAEGLAIRVLNERGAAIDRLLDAGSDRVLPRSGRASLGPLRAGPYVVELTGGRKPLRRQVHVVDRDVRVMFENSSRQNP
jgi:hypothetical protein